MANKETMLKEEIFNLKKSISSEISTIDRILDQMGYGKDIDNKDELIDKQEALEKKHSELRNLEEEVEKSEKLAKDINRLEDQIDEIQLHTFKSQRIEELKQQIEELTEERKKILDSIESKIVTLNNKR